MVPAPESPQPRARPRTLRASDAPWPTARPAPPSAAPSPLRPNTVPPVRLHWVSRGDSALQARVTPGLRAELRSSKAALWRQNAWAQTASEGELVVIEAAPGGSPLSPHGLAFAGQDRQRPHVLVLLPADALASACAWLDAGADRCLPLESEPALIQAMLRALLRRIQGQLATYTEHGRLRFDHDTHTLFHASGRVPLTCRETRVARLFFERGGRPVKPADIWAALGKVGPPPPQSSLIALYVHRINRKIQDHGLHIHFRKTYGYRLTLWPEPSQAALRVDGPGPLPTLHSPRVGSAHLPSSQAPLPPPCIP